MVSQESYQIVQKRVFKHLSLKPWGALDWKPISNSFPGSFLESRVVQFLKMTQFSYSLIFGVPLN